MKRVAGYIRVSSKEQAEKGQSLATQGNAIENFIKNKKEQNWKLINIYSDEGISGASFKNRNALKNLMDDAQKNIFNVLVVHRLSRFGRNARDLLNNVNILTKNNIEFISIKEQIDFSSPYGRAMLTMLGAIAELEREIIGEQSAENRIARAKQKIPTSGKLPIGRLYDKKTGEWSLDKEKAGLIQWAAKEYLKGKSLKDIVHTLRTRHKMAISYAHIHKIFTEKCGDKWHIKFKSEDEPITFDIPRILDEKLIEAIKNRIEFNRTFNRKDTKRKYLLTGFIRCGTCKHSLSGQHQLINGKYEYTYYRHPDGKHRSCKAFSSIRTNKIEDAVFKIIFDNFYDEIGYQEAIKDAFPDEKVIKNLKDRIKKNERELKKVDRKINNLLEAVSEKLLKGETIKDKETELLEIKSNILTELENDKQRLNLMPTSELVQLKGEHIRATFKGYFASKDRYEKMSFEEKRRLLHWIFNGKNSKGIPYGIYIEKKGKEKWDFFIFAELHRGLSTLIGNNHVSLSSDPDDLSRMDQDDAFYDVIEQNIKEYAHLKESQQYKTKKSSEKLIPSKRKKKDRSIYNTNNNRRGH
jgi:site-specific DNA recombinase